MIMIDGDGVSITLSMWVPAIRLASDIAKYVDQLKKREALVMNKLVMRTPAAGG